MKVIKILSVLISIMGLMHITATFSPLISGKLQGLDEATYCAMIYMSLMCGLLLIALGGFVTWAICKVSEIPTLKRPILIATILLFADGVSAVILMPHNPFAWTIGVLCVAILLLYIYSLRKKNRCTLRPFVYDDSAIILNWLSDRRTFRMWSANRYEAFPATPDDMMNLYKGDGMYPMTMVEDGRVVGHLLIKQLVPDKSTFRFCFVIVDNALRGRGYGKELCHLAIHYTKNRLGATAINLGVFTDNYSALECYKSVGFTTTSCNSTMIDGEKWDAAEMTLKM